MISDTVLVSGDDFVYLHRMYNERLYFFNVFPNHVEVNILLNITYFINCYGIYEI